MMIRILQAVGLAVILFIATAIASPLAGALTGFQPPAMDAKQAGTMFAVVCLLHAAVLAYPIGRSHWTGWKLMSSVFAIYFGILGVLTMGEAVVFLPHTLLPGMPGFVIAIDAISGILLAAGAVLVFKRLRPANATTTSISPHFTPAGWAWRFGALSVCYLVVYFTFGALVAWRDPVLRQFYEGAHLENLTYLPLLQLARGLCWAAIGLVIVRMMDASWWERALATGLVFSVLGAAGLLMPNPSMPEPVRMTHLLEVSTSNFLFGLIVAGLFGLKQKVGRQVALPAHAA